MHSMMKLPRRRRGLRFRAALKLSSRRTRLCHYLTLDVRTRNCNPHNDSRLQGMDARSDGTLKVIFPSGRLTSAKARAFVKWSEATMNESE
jgi:hypothetical protein